MQRFFVLTSVRLFPGHTCWSVMQSSHLYNRYIIQNSYVYPKIFWTTRHMLMHTKDWAFQKRNTFLRKHVQHGLAVFSPSLTLLPSSRSIRTKHTNKYRPFTIQEFAVYLTLDYTERHSQCPQSLLDVRLPHANSRTWTSMTTLQDPQISQVQRFM